MKKKYYLMLVTLCVASFAHAQQKFTLNGNISGLRSPMKAFLNYIDGEKEVLDSCLTRNGRFTFNGEISRPTKAVLKLQPLTARPLKTGDRVRSRPEEAELMLEQASISVEGSSLKTSKIVGGPAQNDLVTYNKMMKLAADSVSLIWKAQRATFSGDSVALIKRLTNAKRKAAERRFVLSHGDSYVAYDMLMLSSIAIGDPDDYEIMFKALSPAFKTSSKGKQAAGRLALAKKFAIGKPALNFSQIDDKGQMVSLSDFKGKYVLIDFWASWCEPCRMEYPFLKKAYAQFKDKNFEIIGISLDSKKSLWLDAIKSNGFNWAELCDLQGIQNAVAKLYGVAAIPQSFLIDPQGNIIAKNLRGGDLLEKLQEVTR